MPSDRQHDGAEIEAAGPIVLFDGMCNLCSWSVRFLVAHEREPLLRFASAQSPIGEALLRRHHLPTLDYDSFVLIEDGRASMKSAALFRLARCMTWPWSLLRLGRILPRAWSDFLYDRVARNRYALFGRRDICMVPGPDMAGRFLG